MQLFKTLVIAAIATIVCFSAANAEENKPMNIREDKIPRAITPIDPDHRKLDASTRHTRGNL
ncbi:hypothetical protein P3T76_004790 [Phytophthora citrophthora]|uniref:RxLR effector protein n=1 Tax=Phytophthora citrophthora TaxID=4793 RepID=A0AAD9GQV7_9STRA|nr:hypothetical protein P3T76_004790 [Phytophthora citrophthora]